jgi:SAM-dependent methyltransferase
MHRAARSGFARQADAYLRGRPSYGPDAVAWLLDRLAGRGPVIDVGAGTGALSRLLAERGCPVVAVEPVRAMVERCPGTLARLRAVAGRLPFADGSAGGLSAATAFHWFASAEVLDEFWRCLAAGAPAVLVWNERDDRVGWVARHSALVNRYAGDTPRFWTMEWHSVIDGHPGFEEDDYAEFENPTPMTRAGLVDRILSTSFIADLPPEQLAEARAEAEELADSLPESFEYPYLTRAWCFRRR